MRLFAILLLAAAARATIYYVEADPVAPFFCTAERPCRINDLPSSFTTADQIIFVPATTGTSSTFSFGAKSYTNPSVVISANVIFSACSLSVRTATSVTCNSATLQSTSALSLISVGTFTSTNCAYIGTQVITQSSGSVNFNGGSFSSNTGKRVQFGSNSVVLDGVTFSSSTTLFPALALLTGTADSTFSLQNLQFSSWTTANSKSLIVASSVSGKKFDLTVAGSSISSCTSANALIELEILANSNPAAFTCGADINTFTVSGGSATAGLLLVNNKDDLGVIDATVVTTSATSVNFNSGAAFQLSSSTGNTVLHANTEASISICSPTNLGKLVLCTGSSPANAAVFFAGSVEGSHNAQGCTNPHVDAAEQC